MERCGRVHERPRLDPNGTTSAHPTATARGPALFGSNSCNFYRWPERHFAPDPVAGTDPPGPARARRHAQAQCPLKLPCGAVRTACAAPAAKAQTRHAHCHTPGSLAGGGRIPRPRPRHSNLEDATMPTSSDTRATTNMPVRAHRYNAIDYIALVLMIIGGLNWGLVGTLGVDLVATLFGQMTMVSRIVYGLVGLAALYGIVLLFRSPRD
jgi:uncharacterized membrane protein YuzA (DUF378 family)